MSWGDVGQRHRQVQSPWGEPGWVLGAGRVGNSQPQPTTTTADPTCPCTFHFAGKSPQQQWDLRKGRELHEGSSESTARPQQLSTCGLTLGDKWCWSPNTPNHVLATGPSLGSPCPGTTGLGKLAWGFHHVSMGSPRNPAG